MKPLRVLVACEESQATTKAFRLLGHEAFSCDIKECSGGKPEWHIQGDALEVGRSQKWDLMIGHPPCTYLAVSGVNWCYNKDGSLNMERIQGMKEGLQFVEDLMNLPIPKIIIENPVSVISTQIRKPDQIVQPYFFGDEARKTTCLWLKGVRPLKITNLVGEGELIEVKRKDGSVELDSKWHHDSRSLPKEERSTIRSKTFPGMARAMAEQWGRKVSE